MSVIRFDLIEIVQIIRKHRRFVLIISCIAAVLGAAFYFVKNKKYTATTEFIVSNPSYTDRNNLYSANEMTFIDYFGGDDDIDRVIVLSESDTVITKIVEDVHLAERYQFDMNRPTAMERLKQKFTKGFKIKRTEYKDIELSYTDKDPNIAADVANESALVIEEAFRGYYNNVRRHAYDAIKDKVQGEDSTIEKLTDSLAALREKYGIYDIISPARENVIIGNVKGTSAAGFGKGMEQIQNIEALKDQFVSDRAKHTSYMNEFAAGNKDQLKLTQVISKAKPPVDPSGASLSLTIIACALLGFFFSSFIVLISVYYKAIISLQR
jgi:uncharacterized protein involved in exopolysaccharide biosynthesis